MWIYVPHEALSKSAPAAEASPMDSTSLAALRLFVSSSGKPSPRPLSWPGWRRRSWVKALSGIVLSPSTAARGVDWWIASLAERRARTCPTPGNVLGSTESEADSSGSSSESSKRSSPSSSSGRTLTGQATLFPESSTLSRRSGTAAKPCRFELLTWERRTSALGTSSWPTATFSDGSKGSGKREGSPSLTQVARNWPTTTSKDSKSSGSATYPTTPTHAQGTTLTDAIRAWATPTQANSHGNATRGGARAGEELLPGQAAALWATPAASLFNYGESPKSFEARSARLEAQGTRPLGANLGQQGASFLGTPALTDFKGSSQPGQRRGQLGDQLHSFGPTSRLEPRAVEEFLSRGLPPETPSKPGEQSSPRTRTSPRLNPAFVEWLMGWPIDSTLLPIFSGPTVFGFSETASSPSRRPKRSDSSSRRSPQAEAQSE